MSDLFESPDGGENAPDAGTDNAPEFSVSELTGAIKKTIQDAFGRVRVRGEVGRVTLARSGHLYFDIKDDRSVIASVSWKGQVSRLSMIPEEGMEVVAVGKLTTFGPQSRYQLNVEEVEIAGAGALMALLEKRKKALAAEGLFEQERKKPLPYLPEVIGVVTSPTGAVIRDILHRLRDRFPRKVLIWPVAVQGENCAPQVARAIEGFNAMTPGGALPRPDLLIVARGGGAIEDLWGFNEEIVARAAAASDIPLISAVGHETDTTLIDYVSDLRAPTPTAAAEHAVPVRHELLSWVGDQDARLTRALSQSLNQRGQRLRDLSRALPNPRALVDGAAQRLDLAGARLDPALRSAVQSKRIRLEQRTAPLEGGALRGRLRSERLRLTGLGARLGPGLLRVIDARKNDHARVSSRLQLPTLTRLHDRSQRDAQALFQRFSGRATGQISQWKSQLEGLERLRQTLGYKATLQRGYAVVRGDGALVTTQAAAGAAAALEIEFQDGVLSLSHGAEAKARTSPTPDAGRKADPKPKPDKSDQGSLF